MTERIKVGDKLKNGATVYARQGNYVAACWIKNNKVEYISWYVVLDQGKDTGYIEGGNYYIHPGKAFDNMVQRAVAADGHVGYNPQFNRE